MNQTDATYRRTDVTYRQLDRVLRALGFTYRLSKKEPSARVYEHKETGALIVIAFYPAADRVLDYHLGAVRATLKVYGIADLKDFDTEIEKVG